MLTPSALTLQHWLSPAFPTGAFAFSHGLEQIIARGEVHDAATLEAWLRDLLHFGSGWQDAVLISQGLAETADPDSLDALCMALQTSSERLTETREQGAAFARTVAQITGRNLPARCLPIAVAEAARPLALPVEMVVAAYLQAFVTNLVVISIRHIPLGQGAGHGVLAKSLLDLPELSRQASMTGLQDLGNSCLGAELAAMEHETKEVRLFRT